jgi:hypothetical protein
METISSGTKKLPILNNKVEFDVDAELKAFELEQMAALGLEPGKEHWRDDNPTRFMASQRAHTTILISGLTMAHDFFLQGALRGIGYKVQAIDCRTTRRCRWARSSATAGSATRPTSRSATS